MNFLIWWETGYGLIVCNILLFVLAAASFFIGIRKTVVRNKVNNKSVIKIAQERYNIIGFFAFLGTWFGLTIYMVQKGSM